MVDLMSLKVVATAAYIAILVSVLWGLLRCRHAWELVDKTEFPPPIQDIRSHWHSAMLWSDDVTRLSYRKVVLAMRCSKCGAARIFQATNKA